MKWGGLRKKKHLNGRTDVVHEHFKELFTDPSHAELPDWIEQRWPCESILSLPMIDGVRVSEIAFAFRKRTSCAADHVVIEMFGVLDTDIWETIASCFQFRLMNHWTEDTESVWKTQLVTSQEKEWQAHDAWFPSDCDAADYLPALPKDVAATGGRAHAIKTWSTVRPRPGST